MVSNQYIYTPKKSKNSFVTGYGTKILASYEEKFDLKP